MKLIAILSIEQYHEDLGKIFAQNDIAVYSEVEITGFNTKGGRTGSASNWFAHKKQGVYSTLSFAFVSAEQSEKLLEGIAKYNTDNPSNNPVHAFQLGVEKSV